MAPVIDCLSDANIQVRIFACQVLANIGPDAKAALPALRDLVGGNNVQVQQAARNAVERIAGKEKE